MKKFNLTVIAASTALFVFGIIAFQPDTTEANSNASPTATPRKRVAVINKNANVKVKRPKSLNGGIESLDNWDTSRKHTSRKNKIKHNVEKRVRKP